ncbi:Snf7-domain-containing protein [Blakeslea trispora]|nr:Snf7-domain-containing protein [Blakeslea trispora]
MEKEQELVALENFESVFSNSNSWLGWIYDNVVKTTWQWRWRPLSDALPHPPQQYVVVPTLKALAKAILDHHYQHSKRATEDVMTLSQFSLHYRHHFMNQLELTDNDIQLVLQYLHSQHGLAVQEHVKGYGAHYTILKFPPQASKEPARITKHDEALINIRTTCHALSAQVDELQRQTEALTQASIQEKNQGHTAKALYCLKRKKNLQQILERRLKSMETMDTILMKIESSQDDLQIVQAFNTGADTLKSLLGDNGLSVESVDEAMSQLQYVLQDQKEIEDAMKMGMDDISAMDTDSTDIEDELSHLIQEEEQQKQQQQQQKLDISRAPSVPNTQPIQSELSRLNQMFSQSDSNQSRRLESPEFAS